MTSRGARVYLNGLIAPYGRLVELRIDSRQRTIEASCLLHGESEPIVVTVGSYVVETDGSKRFLRVCDCACTRAWAQALLKNLVEGRRLELPAWAAAALS